MDRFILKKLKVSRKKKLGLRADKYDLFLEAMEKYGKDYEKIANYVGESKKQIRYSCRRLKIKSQLNPKEKGANFLPIL